MLIPLYADSVKYHWPISTGVLMLAIVYVSWDVVTAINSPFGVSTSLLHMIGAGVGLVMGLLMLWKGNWVYTANRDLGSMIQEVRGLKLRRQPRPKTQSQLAIDETKRAERRQLLETRRRSIDLHLKAGNLDTAITLFRKLQVLDSDLRWSESQLLALILGSTKQRKFEQALRFADEYLNRDGPRAASIGLLSCKTCLVELESPRRARSYWERLRSASMTGEQMEAARRLDEAIERKIQSGDLEII